MSRASYPRHMRPYWYLRSASVPEHRPRIAQRYLIAGGIHGQHADRCGTADGRAACRSCNDRFQRVRAVTKMLIRPLRPAASFTVSRSVMATICNAVVSHENVVAVPETLCDGKTAPSIASVNVFGEPELPETLTLTVTVPTTVEPAPDC